MKHTPEPWHLSSSWGGAAYIGSERHGYVPVETPFQDDAGEGGADFRATAEANAARIVACVNACAGMEDPGAEIERLERIEVAALALLNCHTGASWQTQGIRDRAFRDLSAAVQAAEGGGV